MLSTVTEQTSAGQAAAFFILALAVCGAIVTLAIFAWGIGLHLADLRAKRCYRRNRDAQRKLERDLRTSRPVGGVSRRYSN